MNKRMTTNCPNCGGELTSDGYCKYCNTKVRYANEVIVDLQNSVMAQSDVELMITVKRENEIILIPFKGWIDSFREDLVDPFYADIISGGIHLTSIYDRPRISITFSGYAQEASETVVNETIKGVRTSDS